MEKALVVHKRQSLIGKGMPCDLASYSKETLRDEIVWLSSMRWHQKLRYNFQHDSMALVLLGVWATFVLPGIGLNWFLGLSVLPLILMISAVGFSVLLFSHYDHHGMHLQRMEQRVHDLQPATILTNIQNSREKARRLFHEAQAAMQRADEDAEKQRLLIGVPAFR